MAEWEIVPQKSKDDKCARCGKTRSWHLGQGGMGICRPEFLDASSELNDDDARTGGFVEIEMAPQVAVDDLGPFVDKVCEAIGHPEALVTDESCVSDFLQWGEEPYRTRRGGLFSQEPWEEHPADPAAAEENKQMLERASAALGFPVERGELLVSLARKLRDMGRG
jgi:hypothetical protein